MTTQTAIRREVHAQIDDLPDSAIEMLASYVASLKREYEDGFFPHIPNAETASAIREGQAGNVKSAKSIKEFFEAMNGEDEND